MYALFAVCFLLPALTADGVPSSGVDLRCGGYSLYVGMKALGLNIPDYPALEAKLGQPTGLGYSMRQLSEAVEAFGGHSLGVETSLEALEERGDRFACVALLESSRHFVCLYEIDRDNVYLVDPPNRRVVSRDAFHKIWSGKALLISDHPLRLHVSRRKTIVIVLICCAVLIVVTTLGWLKLRHRHRVAAHD